MLHLYFYCESREGFENGNSKSRNNFFPSFVTKVTKYLCSGWFLCYLLLSGYLIRHRSRSKSIERSFLFAIIDLLLGANSITLYFIWRGLYILYTLYLVSGGEVVTSPPLSRKVGRSRLTVIRAHCLRVRQHYPAQKKNACSS